MISSNASDDQPERRAPAVEWRGHAGAATALQAILEVVRSRRGTDFAAYRPDTVLRRVQNRALSAGATTLEDYLGRLRSDPAEVGQLLQRLTIKVSRFYRNPEVIPAVRAALAARATAAPGGRVRVWSAGCGRGEEAYTLAILLAELGQPAAPGQVIGSDIDPAALEAAAAARFPPEALADLPPDLRARYLEADPAGRGAQRVCGPLLGRVALRLHDLTRAAAPPAGGGFDLVSCRNTLIYFRPEVRIRAERLLLSGVASGGLLWLGEAEWPSPEAERRLAVVDRRARLFRARREGEA